MAESARESFNLVQVCNYSIDFLRELGRGGFGTVYKGFHCEGQIVAIKKVSKTERQKASAEAVKFHFLKENIRHGNIIMVNDVKTWEDSMWIVMEYCDFGDLNNFFSKYHKKSAQKQKLTSWGK